MRSRRWSGMLLLAALAGCPTLATPPVSSKSPETQRPRTALVLSGGGARGAAHVGVLEVLEELHIPVDYVLGTSMGAVVGGLYASGMSPAQIRALVQEIDWNDVFSDRPRRKNVSFRRKQDDDEALFRFELGVKRSGIVFPSGLVAGQKLSLVLRRATLHTAGIDDFDELPIPFRAVATDLATGKPAVLKSGDLALAIRSSMAVPGAFTPGEIEGRVLVDGGLVNNLPVDVARSLGADRIIAVDVSQPLQDISGVQSLIGIAAQTILVLTDQNVQEQRALLGDEDILLVPELDGMSSADFEHLFETMTKGSDSAHKNAARLRAFSVNSTDFNAHRLRQRQVYNAARGGRVYEAIDVEGLERVDPKYLTQRIESRPGHPLDLDVLERDLERIYETGEFEQVDFGFREADTGEHLVIRAREKSWGPNFLRLGLGLDSNFAGEGDFQALGVFTRTQLNRLGAEWKIIAAMGEPDLLFSEIYQPLDYRGTWFVAPQFEFQQFVRAGLDDDGNPAVIENETFLGRFDIGVQLGNWGEFRVGAERGTIDNGLSSPLGNFNSTVGLGNLRARVTLDHLDNANFPRDGHLSRLDARLAREFVGADNQYDRVGLRVLQAESFGKNTLLGRIEIGTDLGSEIPVYDQFRLGGFLNVSGLQTGQLQGGVLGYLGLVYYREIGRMPGPIGGGVYLGGALEAGNAWPGLDHVAFGDLHPAALAFGGVDTLFGPIYFGYGRSDGGEDAFYLILGKPF